jgi:hypothetical protein
MQTRLQAQALHTCMKPALLRRPRLMPSPPCPGLPHAIIHPSLFRPAMHPPAPRLLFRLLRHDLRSASRLHRGSIPGIQCLSEAGMLERARARRFPSSPAVVVAPWTPRPRSSRAVASSRRAFDAHCARTSTFIALSTSPRLHATHPQHYPRTSRGTVLMAGGREVNESLRVLVLGSSGMMCMLRVCGCVHPGLVSAGAGVTAGAGEDGDMILVCTARVQEEGPAPWGVCEHAGLA